MSSTSSNLYCSKCDQVTEHVRVSYTDIQALKKIMEHNHGSPDHKDLASQIYQKYPNWLKDVSLGSMAILAPIYNGISNYFLKKDYAALWICSKCKHYHTRIFE